MASGSSSLLKGVFVLLFIGAVFTGLTFILEEAPETPIATTPVASSGTSSSGSSDPAVAEARQLGAEIGTRVGEEIGRRVGQILVANLEVPDSTEGDTGGEAPVMVAETPDTSESEEQSDSSEAEVVADADSADEMMTDDSEVSEMASDSDSAMAMDDEVEDMSTGQVASSDAEYTSSHTIAKEPAIPAPTPAPVIESEPDPSKNFVFSSSGWWNASANGKGLRIVHVGQAVSATGVNRSIVVILSAPFKGNQNLEKKIKVNDDSGNAVDGTWRRSANARTLFMHVDEPGTYQVSFSGDLMSRDDLSIGMDLSGPVTIR